MGIYFQKLSFLHLKLMTYLGSYNPNGLFYPILAIDPNLKNGTRPYLVQDLEGTFTNIAFLSSENHFISIAAYLLFWVDMRHTNFNFPSRQTLLLGFIMIYKFAYTNCLFILIKSCILKNEAKSLNLIAISICIVFLLGVGTTI